MSTAATDPIAPPPGHHVGSDLPFYFCFAVIGAAYVLLLLGMLVADVAYSTLESDQTIKNSTYARARIPEYWLWNLQDWQLEVYREPVTLAIGNAGYRVRTVYLADETIAPLAFPDCPVHVGDILPARLK
mgnify:CR=1 FL=1